MKILAVTWMDRIGHIPNLNPAACDPEVESVRQVAQLPTFESLFEEFYPLVYGVGLKFAGKPEDAEDIAQEVFTKVWKNLDSFNYQSSLKTWIYRIAINACIDYSRKPWKKHDSKKAVLDEPSGEGAVSELACEEQTAENRLLAEETAREVRRAIARLKPHLKTVLILKDLEEMSYEEISGVLGVSLGTISSRLNRARKALQTLLGTARLTVVPET